MRCLEHFERASVVKCSDGFIFELEPSFAASRTINSIASTPSGPYASSLISRLSLISAFCIIFIKHLLKEFQDVVEEMNDILPQESSCIRIVLRHQLSNSATDSLSLVLVVLELLLYLVNTHIVQYGLTGSIFDYLIVIVQGQQ